jgi:riboflavin synthase
MFTGLIQATGQVVSVRRLETGVHIEVDAQGLSPRPIRVGDSIAVNGVCLTATGVSGWRFGADVSRETLSLTAGLDACGVVNLETSLALGDTLGGHLVSGHVDGVGTIVRMQPEGESVQLVVRAPARLARFLAPKGSVAIDGVSLTVNRVADSADETGACDISINLIPHTVANTAFREAAAGRRVNLEVDLIARYVARMLAADIPASGAAPASAALPFPTDRT